MDFEAIKSIVSSKGWQLIRGIFEEEISNGRNIKEIKTEGLTDKQIAIEVIAAQKAAKMVEKVLNKIDRISAKTDNVNQTYR